MSVTLPRATLTGLSAIFYSEYHPGSVAQRQRGFWPHRRCRLNLFHHRPAVVPDKRPARSACPAPSLSAGGRQPRTGRFMSQCDTPLAHAVATVFHCFYRHRAGAGLNSRSAHSRKRCMSAQPRWRKCCSWVPLPPWPTLAGTTAFSREICPCWRPPPVLRRAVRLAGQLMAGPRHRPPAWARCCPDHR